MIPNSIRLADALQQMETATTGFSLRFVKASRTRRTGGQIVEWHDCRLSRPKYVKGQAQPVSLPTQAPASHLPAHFRNATRNLSLGTSSQIRKVNIWLILSFNGQKVV